MSMMAILTIITVVFATMISSSYSNGVQAIKFSGEHKRQTLKNFTNAVKTRYGDIYDCVDTYKQSSLSHPALKGHKIQVRPSKEVEDMVVRHFPRNATSKMELKNIWSTKKACQEGTVPIRRMTPKQRRKTRDTSQKLQISHPRRLNWENGLEFAGLYGTPGKKLTGVSSIVSIHKPKVGPHQFSSSIMAVETGQGNNLNQIKVGWIVYPEIYGDNRTRLYTAWTRDGHRNTGCYNTFCPGFVIVSHEVPLDYAFPSISIINGDQHDIPLLLGQDMENGVWWLIFNNLALGYWPSSLFDSLGQGADTVRWGGEVFTKRGDKVSPPMGSGKMVNYNPYRTCYMRRLGVSDQMNTAPTFDSIGLKGVNSRCYLQGGSKFLDDPYWYDHFFFGGSGGTDRSICFYTE